MKLHRFFGHFDFRKEKIFIDDKDVVNQWRNVLCFEVGSEIILCDGKLNEALGRIVSFSRNSATVEILGVSKNENESEGEVVLYCSILKGEHFEFVAEKATELGVKKIVPIVCERTVKKNIHRERLEKIIKEAAEQSGRGIIPELVGEPLSFMIAARQAAAHDVNFFFHSDGKDIESFAGKSFRTAGVFIGPEGGWKESEIELAKKSGFHIATLGKLTLRAETAAIVAVYSVLSVI